MIFLRLKLTNLCMFDGAEIDFTYPRKRPHSPIADEYLSDFPNIKFKRVNIFMGPNASGKTTLGKLMCSINNYLYGNPMRQFPEIIHHKDQPAGFEVTYITPDSADIHHMEVQCDAKGVVKEVYRRQPLSVSKSQPKTLEDIRTSPPVFYYDKQDPAHLHNVSDPGFKSVGVITGKVMPDSHQNTFWHYLFSDGNTYSGDLIHENFPLLKRVLQAFDNAIADVTAIDGSDQSYLIRFENGDGVIVEKGKITEQGKGRLSRGTQEAIEVASLLNSILQSKKISSTFFLDEKMAYSHSEMEMAMLNVMIDKLNPHSQLFYTTHNHDILDMNLPSHSFTFLKKDDGIQVYHPEKMGFTQNDRSLSGYVKNDVFSTMPDTCLIDELLWQD